MGVLFHHIAPLINYIVGKFSAEQWDRADKRARDSDAVCKCIREARGLLSTIKAPVEVVFKAVFVGHVLHDALDEVEEGFLRAVSRGRVASLEPIHKTFCLGFRLHGSLHGFRNPSLPGGEGLMHHIAKEVHWRQIRLLRLKKGFITWPRGWIDCPRYNARQMFL